MILTVQLESIIFHCMLFLVCKAGYYKTEGSCTMCTENTIKKTAGNGESCNEQCGGVTVNNADHTDCGMPLL